MGQQLIPRACEKTNGVPMSDDEYALRKGLTFSQAEGLEPLPRQLALTEISQELRAKLWAIVHLSLENAREHSSITGGSYFSKRWRDILWRMHVMRDHRMVDEFKNDCHSHVKALKVVFATGAYHEVFSLVQWLLQQPERPIHADVVRRVLADTRAAYRLLDDGCTIVPVASEEEGQAVQKAFADVAAAEFSGAREHLRNAANELTAGSAADSIRESIHAVESVARSITGKGSLSDALKFIKQRHNIHAAMEQGLNRLYGWASDEKGVRHPLLDDPAAKVDETDAIFMLGACSSFVSYLIARSGKQSPASSQ